MELLKKGKRTYGAFIKIPSGECYVAFRTPNDFFLDGKKGELKTVAGCMADGRAAWAIDDEHIRMAQRRGCKFILVYVRKLKWVFITKIENYLDRSKYYRRNYEGRGGANQRYLSTRYFVQRNLDLNIGPTTT